MGFLSGNGGMQCLLASEGVMQEFAVNYWAVLVAGLARFVVGMVWYAPPVLGRPWQAIVKLGPDQMRAGIARAIVVDLIGSVIMAWVLVHAVHYAGAASWAQGAAVGFFNWLGFVGVVTLSMGFYEQRPLRLFLINNGYQLLTLLVMGAIVAVWV
jgi:Protein of unknown function (DUF1761)